MVNDIFNRNVNFFMTKTIAIPTYFTDKNVSTGCCVSVQHIHSLACDLLLITPKANKPTELPLSFI